MPNHVTTRCVITGPAAAVTRFKATVFTKELEVDAEVAGLRFDFNALIPMPEIVRNTEASSDSALGYEALTGRPEPGSFDHPSVLTYPWLRERGVTTREELRAYLERERPAALEAGRRCVEAEKATGSHSWYVWALENWGTKWNSYDLHIADDSAKRLEFCFDTAWSFPTPVFEALVGIFPELTIEAWCFDEGWGFAGQFVDGEYIDRKPTDVFYARVYGTAPMRDEADAAE